MNWKESLKPTKSKVIISVIITLLWAGFLLNAVNSAPLYCLGLACIEPVNTSVDDSLNLEKYSLFRHQQCCYEKSNPVSLSVLINEYAILFIIPFMLSYLLISIIKRK